MTNDKKLKKPKKHKKERKDKMKQAWRDKGMDEIADALEVAGDDDDAFFDVLLEAHDTDYQNIVSASIGG